MPQVEGYQQKVKAISKRLWLKKYLAWKIYQIPQESIHFQVLVVYSSLFDMQNFLKQTELNLRPNTSCPWSTRN